MALGALIKCALAASASQTAALADASQQHVLDPVE